MATDSWWGTIADLAGSALDYLDDNEWLGNTITRLIAENPELDYDKILELAVQEATLNAPNVYTPQGTTTTTFDPETNQPTITKTYTPEIQALYEMLVGNAGAPIDTYHAPDSFQPMLGKYINDREDHMGLPNTTYTPWARSQGGARNFPQAQPNLPPTSTKTSNGDGSAVNTLNENLPGRHQLPWEGSGQYGIDVFRTTMDENRLRDIILNGGPQSYSATNEILTNLGIDPMDRGTYDEFLSAVDKQEWGKGLKLGGRAASLFGLSSVGSLMGLIGWGLDQSANNTFANNHFYSDGNFDGFYDAWMGEGANPGPIESQLDRNLRDPNDPRNWGAQQSPIEGVNPVRYGNRFSNGMGGWGSFGGGGGGYYTGTRIKTDH